MAIACGNKHTAAVQADGTLWIWGTNDSGQLGDGTRTDRLKPVKVQGISEIAGVVCGREHTVALKQGGTVFSWGANGSGQLGDGTKTEKLRPVQVLGLAKVAAIAGGSDFNLALKKDGTLWGWGSDVYGELGDAKTLESVEECLPDYQFTSGEDLPCHFLQSVQIFYQDRGQMKIDDPLFLHPSHLP